MATKPSDEELDAAIDLYRRGDTENAITSLEILSARFPEHATCRGLLGGYYWDEEEYQQARPHLEAAVLLNPKSKIWALALFHTYFDLNFYDEALCELQRFEAVTQSVENRTEWRTLIRDLKLRMDSPGNSA